MKKLILVSTLLFSASLSAHASDVLAPFLGSYVATQSTCEHGHGLFPGWALQSFELSENAGLPKATSILETGRTVQESWVASSFDHGSRGTATTSVDSNAQYDAVFDVEWTRILMARVATTPSLN